jgi:hypothetical protein
MFNNTHNNTMFTTTQNLIACNVALPCFDEEFNAYHLEGNTNGQFMAYLTHAEAKRAKELIERTQPHLVVTLAPTIYEAEGRRLYTLQDNETDLYAWELLEEPAMEVVEEVNVYQQRCSWRVGGSIQNIIASNNATTPVAGTYCTELLHTDREVFHVTEVTNNGRFATLEHCRPKYVSEDGYGSNQFTHEGYKINVKWRYGKWCKVTRDVVFTKEFIAYVEEQGGDKEAPFSWLIQNKPEWLELVASDGYWLDTILKGVTKEVWHYQPIRLVFGVANYYRDPSF